MLVGLSVGLLAGSVVGLLAGPVVGSLVLIGLSVGLLAGLLAGPVVDWLLLLLLLFSPIPCPFLALVLSVLPGSGSEPGSQGRLLSLPPLLVAKVHLPCTFFCVASRLRPALSFLWTMLVSH